MAVTVDKANIYTGAGTAQTNHTITTTQAVAAGAMIVVLCHRFNASNTTQTCSGGGLTWNNAHTRLSGSIRITMMYAFAPAGLASGSTLTVNGSGGGNDYTVCAASYLGVDSTGTVVATGDGAAATAAWASGSVAGNSGNALIGGAAGDGTLRTSTPTSPANERIDFNSATSSGSITLVDKLSVSGSDTLAGTWSGTLTHVVVAAAFKDASTGTSLTPASLVHTRGTSSPSVIPKLAPASLSHTRGISSPMAVPKLAPASLVHTRGQGTVTVTNVTTLSPVSVTHTRGTSSPTVNTSTKPLSLLHVRGVSAPKVNPSILLTGLTHSRGVGSLTIPGGAGTPQDEDMRNRAVRGVGL